MEPTIDFGSLHHFCSAKDLMKFAMGVGASTRMALTRKRELHPPVTWQSLWEEHGM